jgi:hypothetical protein
MRTIAAALATLIILGESPAGAQDSNTNCYRTGDFTHCNTTTSPDYDGGGALSGFVEGFESNGGLTRAFERRNERRADSAKRRRYTTAGKLIDAGQCPEARSFALNSGDLDLAQRVTALCPLAPAR